MASLLIINANIVNEGTIIQGDVLIQEQRIAQISSDLSGYPADQVIDAAGRFLLPGMIDSHVTFREPGLTHKGDFASESLAAVAGGITSFMDMPNNVPYVLSMEAIQGKQSLAQDRSWANYGFYLGAASDNLDDIKGLDPKQVCGVKVLTGAPNHNEDWVDDPEQLSKIFRESPILVAMHCEDMPTILETEASYRCIYGEQIPVELHPMIRSSDACILSSSMVVALAQAEHARLHLLQLSTAGEVEFLSHQPLEQKRITAEVCAHYLRFTDADYPKLGALIKYDPAIKTAEDQAQLYQGLLDGRLDIISSGHTPHTWEEKHQESYFDIPSGFPSVQHTLPALLESYHDGIFSLEFIVEKTSHAVATLFNVKKRGYIREGYWADLVLVDLAKPWIATHEASLYKCGWTPFVGQEFRSSIDATIVNGTLVWYEGKRVATHATGQALTYDRLSL